MNDNSRPDDGQNLKQMPAVVPDDAHPVRDEHAVVSPAQMAQMQQDSPSDAASDAEVEKRIRQMSRRSFLQAALAVGAGYGGLRWLNSRALEDGVVWPLRQALRSNEYVWRDLYRTSQLAPEFPNKRARTIRVNGDFGMSEDFDPAAWKLSVEGLADADAPMQEFPLAQIKALPKIEMTTELKCIEGWATVVHWSGARLADFIAKYPPATQSGDVPDVRRRPQDLLQYVGLMTPDGGYYVGLEMASALHPQTLLCYEMNGKALTLEHGAPLRLVTPLKYGIKSIKRIGTLTYSNQRPADYWAEQGYDYYAGH